ncbi:MAG TPA: dihydrolipoyl dehydrogenase [Tepidisphaeraceae bacterium]|nr:dihydrolipoyl dehydrogenase [Tepidisphaeraceae bacterium]
MPAEITMPQLSDTMTEGKVVKWHKKEGDKIAAGEEIADVETDKAVMSMEAFDSGTLAHIAIQEGQAAPVGAVLAVIATGKENAADVKKNFKPVDGGAAKVAAAAPAPVPQAPAAKPQAAAATAGPAPAAATSSATGAAKAPAPGAAAAAATGKRYDFDIVVIGGGPAGYAAAIRAGQLKKRVLCIEKENLGGTCLNWGCIPTKALLEDGAFVRKIRTEAAHRGITVGEVKVDFAKIVARSRGIADKLQKGIGHLFRKYEVKHEMGTGQLLGAHRVKYTTSSGGAKEVSAEHVILATGARPVELPFAKFDGKQIITSREAMNLPQQPKRLAIIGAGAIGCEFGDFYNAVGTEVTIVEMLDNLLPNEDTETSVLLERSFQKRGIKVLTRHKTDKIDRVGNAVRLTVTPAAGGASQTIEVDAVLVAVGVSGNVENVAAPEAKLELFKNRIKVDPKYRTNLENVWAVGDCVSLHWPEQSSMAGYRHPDLAHVAHHEAVKVVDRIGGFHEADGDSDIDYRFIPGCTYTHPQVASMGLTEKKARELAGEIRVGKFPFSVSGRALAAGETEGFVKLIFDAKYGELLGVHMIGENVTELLSELVMAKKLEATEDEIIEAMHPHPTMSEAVMEAAGVADGRAIHL